MWLRPPDALSQVPRWALLALFALTLSLGSEGCEVEQAIVTPIPPSTVLVVQALTCGGVRCWERWVESDGKRIRSMRACTTEASSNVPESLVTVPTPLP